jgi:hypothetical protein
MNEDTNDIVSDDFTIPNETVIYFSKRKLITGLITYGIIFCGSGIYFLFTDNGRYRYGSILLIAGGVYLCLKTLLKFNKKAQIIINSEGMQDIANAPFYKWSEIENEEASTLFSGKGASSFLDYDSPKGTIQIRIGDLNISVEELNNLMAVYRKRSENKLKH